MGNKILRFIFFGNYFVGLLAVALTIEATLQLRLPFNSINYYLLLFLAPIVYYTYAYHNLSDTPSLNNPRSRWYFKHRRLVNISQPVLFAACVILGSAFLYCNYHGIINLSSEYWAGILVIILAGLLYYGLLPKSLPGLNLRSIGWLKAFLIGFVWACCANVLPVIFLKIEFGDVHPDPLIWCWLFVKNWMFCAVNANLFDIKDYPDDANKHLKTFVVRFGLRTTLFYVLIPLLIIGIISLFIFVRYEGFGPIPFILNAFPFVLTIYVAYSMKKRQNILYYLMVIDGIILVKALCGMCAMFFIP